MTFDLASSMDVPADPALADAAVRLQRLTERVRLTGLGHRRISDPDPRALSAALLRDIDETILPRHVRVSANSGRSFTLDIAGRRLLRLVVPGHSAPVGHPDDPVALAQAIAADLQRAVAHATELTLQTYRMDSAQDRSDVGCSAKGLADAMGLDLGTIAGEDLTDRVLRVCMQQASAVIVIDENGHVVREIGPDQDTQRLLDMAEDHLADIADMMKHFMGRSATRGCLTLGSDPTSGDQVIYTVQDNTHVLARTSIEGASRLLPALQDTFAR